MSRGAGAPTGDELATRSLTARLLAVLVPALCLLGAMGGAFAAPGVSPRQREAIEKNAALVQELLGKQAGMPFDYGPRSVEWIDGYISRIRTTMKDTDRLSQVLGSYVGEAIRRRDGGRWVRERDGTIGLELAPEFVAYPFAKVAKHFANGEGDSVYSFYGLIPSLLATHRAAGSRAPRRD